MSPLVKISSKAASSYAAHMVFHMGSSQLFPQVLDDGNEGSDLQHMLPPVGVYDWVTDSRVLVTGTSLETSFLQRLPVQICYFPQEWKMQGTETDAG